MVDKAKKRQRSSKAKKQQSSSQNKDKQEELNRDVVRQSLLQKRRKVVTVNATIVLQKETTADMHKQSRFTPLIKKKLQVRKKTSCSKT